MRQVDDEAKGIVVGSVIVAAVIGAIVGVMLVRALPQLTVLEGVGGMAGVFAIIGFLIGCVIAANKSVRARLS